MNVSDKIEVASNLATIAAASLLSAVLVKVYFLPTSRGGPAAPAVRIGTSLKTRLPGVGWAKDGPTLVLGLSTQCHFCTDSAPFYRRLTQSTGINVRTVALLPQPVPEAQQYLVSHGVPVDEVRQVAGSSIGLTATPTLLLVDAAGVVTDIWVGKLQPEQEARVLEAVKRRSGG
jgi:hypothetical protein